jgi:SpoVK/Ycf46/Vps4 family AAA+-type ATPase
LWDSFPNAFESKTVSMGDFEKTNEDLFHLARLALVGRNQDVQTFIQRLAKRYRESIPDLSTQLQTLLQESPTRQSPLRRESTAPLPVDMESRLQLLRVEQHPSVEVEPIWDAPIATALNQIISERQRAGELTKAGLSPTRSVIFTGPPGVGKSLAARWIANALNRPLLILDLSAVMSSYLGRTGANVRHVLDYAKTVDCVLLLDELDSIAKRRDDATDIGELKRLVTVLLQEIDDWPSSGLLIAATNHAELLDPAVWRRFELQVAFPMPTDAEAELAIQKFLGKSELSKSWCEALAAILKGQSFSDIEREVTLIRRAAVMHSQPLEKIVSDLVRARVGKLSKREKMEVAVLLSSTGMSQRHVNELTGVSRDTIRKRSKSRPDHKNDED